ncbi:homeobox-domain-containing protein [Leucogyrophana mollusca]|uniref:Homeobox-domain-containing protein n=1 Tax=Leucogyrophana mollusca TaxID=85980 RepID=A0ACB8BXA6_9AGAM|nr:homeobox-domain-containing protein [Leucogyrophana mollusca]
MTSQRDDRYYGSLAKARKSPPGGESQSSGFFQTGQGGRTVLPPLSSAFPTSRSPVPGNYSSNAYLQPRSSQGRSDHSASLYGQWPNTAPQQHTTPFYEQYDSRYPAQAQNYPSYQSRNSPTLPADPHPSRKLPPLNPPSAVVRDDRWQGANYGSATAHASGYGDIRSPTAQYPAEYAPYHQQHQNTYSYPPVPDPRHHSNQLTSAQHSQQLSMGGYPAAERGLPAQVEAHGPSPYARSHTSVMGTVLTNEPAAMLAGEEPAIKKKRKRADAAQLKVLNETYDRTAFPSTEERAELARKLDMSARSVQIWFQNKRQSMRQTSRQTSTSANTSSRQSFSISSQPEEITSSYGGGSISPTTVPSQPAYLPRSTQESRSIAQVSQSPLPSHRRRSDEEADPRTKWTGHSSRY